MKNKQKLLIFLLVVVVILYIATGYIKRPDVSIGEFSTSDDGRTMTINIGVMSSIGYVRDIHIETEGTIAYIDFYKTFGGANSSYGAKDEFSFELAPEIDEIKVGRGESGYETQLIKSASGEWFKP